MPVHASASANGAFASRSSRPVRDASESSVTSSPPRPRTTHSPTFSQRRAARVPGTLSASQRSFGALQSAVTGRPVVRMKRRSPTSAPSAAASAPPRASCQAIAGASGSPRPSRSTPVSAMPVTPIPRTRPSGAAASAADAASSAASSRARGSISAPVGTFRQGVGAWPWARSAPSASTTAALHADVPTSMPSSRSVTARAPRPAAGTRSPRPRPRGGTGPPPTARGPCRLGARAAARRPRPGARPRPR